MRTVGYFEKMSSLLPIRSEPSTGGQEPRVVDLEGEDAEQVFSALSSSTARRIVATLHEEPRTQSDVAEELDTTVQNVRYHLDKLEEAGLVEVVDTWYSSRGNEMKVYAPADGALIVSGDEGTASRLRSALSRLIGGVAILGLASLFIQTLVERFGRLGGVAGDRFVQRGGDGGDDGPPGAGNMTDEYQFGDTATEGMDPAGGDATTTEAPMATRTTTTESDAAETVTDVQTTTGGPPNAETATATATPDPTGTPAPSPTPTATPAPSPTPTATPTLTATETATATQTATETVTATQTATETTTVADSAKEAAVNATTTVDPGAAAPADPGGLPPGMLFFLGGASVLVALTAVWYLSGR